MRRAAVVGLAGVLVVGALLVGCPARGNSLTLFNNDPNYSIVELNLAPADTADWRVNVLIGTLSPWQQMRISGIKDGQYDIRVVYDRSGPSGDFGELWVTESNVEITDSKSYTVTATTAGLTVE